MATLMVHLELGHANTKLLQAAADLAGRLNADVIGIAACQPLQIIYGDGYVSGDLIEQDREELEKEINDAETEFRAALQKHSGSLEWRSTVTFRSLADYLADQARCADLVITGVDRSGSIFELVASCGYRGLDHAAWASRSHRPGGRGERSASSGCSSAGRTRAKAVVLPSTRCLF